MHRHPRLQFCAPCICVSPSSFLRHTEKSIFYAQIHRARTISISKEKQGDAEFISMLPITSAEERADDADAKGCMCLEGTPATE